MNIRDLNHKIQMVQQLVEALQRQATQVPAQREALLPVAVQELQHALEELQVAQEELLQQNEELALSRQAVEAECQRYQELFDFAPDGYLVTDAEGTIQEANHAAAANQGLEAFSYSISHDLRAPLRAMDGFSRLLLEDYAPQLSLDAHRYLQKVRDNAQQMGQLIDDLLAFSRLSRQPLKTQPVA